MIQPRTTTPTADQLCSEGFQTIAGRAPSAPEHDRAVKVWMEEALLDVWQFATKEDITRFKILENSATLVLTKGKRRYDLPEDFHRPIAVTLLKGSLSGAVATDAEAADIGAIAVVAVDGGTTLAIGISTDFPGGTFELPPSYVLSGRYLVMTSGPAEGVMREIVSAETWFNNETVHLLALDDAWITPEVPTEEDTFVVAEESGVWIAEDMREHMDHVTSRRGLGLPVSFNEHDRTLEFDVASESGDYAVLLRYWSNPVKINKESTVMQSILTNWRVPLTRYIEWRTAKAIDDTRVTALKRDYEEARLAVVLDDYDRGPAFQGFRPYR